MSGKTINFKVNGVDAGSAVTNARGIATFEYTITQFPGNYVIYAEFLQDAVYNGSNGTNNLNVPYTPTNITVNAVTGYKTDDVNLIATLVDLAHSSAPLSGKTIHFTVNGSDAGTAITNASGIATLLYNIPFNAGNYTIYAEFLQDSLYAASNGINNLTVPHTPTNITVNAVTGYNSDTVNLVATLKDTAHNTPISGKTLYFKVNGTSVGTATTNASGIATLQYTIGLNAGNYTILVEFPQDATYNASNGTNNLTVPYTPTSLTVNSTTGYNTDTVNLIATLTDTAHSNTPLSGKTVHFTVNGVDAGSAITNAYGVATRPYTIPLNPGTYTIFAQFQQDLIYDTSTGTNNLAVNKTPTNITVNPVTGYNTDTVNLVATLKDTAHNTPISGKTIHFTVNGADAGSAITNASGIATISYIINLNANIYTILAEFEGDTIYNESTGTNNLTVPHTPTNITVNAVTGYNSDTVNLIATLKDTAHNTPISGKTLYFKVNGTSVGIATTNASGIATLQYTIGLNAGNYTILVEFPQDATYNASNGTNNLTVPYTPTSLTVNSTSGYNTDTVNLIATLTDTAHSNTPLSGKTVHFTVNGADAGSAITNAYGVATRPYTIPLNPGTYTIFAQFQQDLIYNTSTGTNNLAVNKTPTNTTVNPITGYNTDTVNLIATLTDTAHSNTPISGKTIHFTVNGADAGSAITNASGIATISYVINLNANIYTILAEFEGDTIYNTSTGTNNLTVPHTPTNITINPAEGYWNDTITITANLTDTAHSNPELLTPNQQTGTDTLGNTTGFNKWGSNVTLNSTTEQAHSGNRSLKIITTGSNYGTYVTSTASPSTTYTGKMWIYAPLGTNFTIALVNNDWTTITSIIKTGTGTWQYVEINGTTKTTATNILLVIRCNDATTTTIYADDLSLKPTNNIIPVSGKTVNFNIQGDPTTYQATTNADGTATIQYKITQNTGTYNIQATFNGDEIYTGTTNTTTLTVY